MFGNGVNDTAAVNLPSSSGRRKTKSFKQSRSAIDKTRMMFLEFFAISMFDVLLDDGRIIMWGLFWLLFGGPRSHSKYSIGSRVSTRVLISKQARW